MRRQAARRSNGWSDIRPKATFTSNSSVISEREEEWRNQAAIRIARSLKLPVLATNGVRYATAYDREILDLFTAIRHHADLDHAGRLLSLNGQRHLRPAREMAALFRDVPGAIAEHA